MIVDEEYRVAHVSYDDKYKTFECNMQSLLHFKLGIEKAFRMTDHDQFIFYYLE